MFTQAADHDNEDLKERDHHHHQVNQQLSRQQELNRQLHHHHHQTQTYNKSARNYHSCENSSSNSPASLLISSPSSNPNTNHTSSSNKSSLSSPPLVNQPHTPQRPVSEHQHQNQSQSQSNSGHDYQNSSPSAETTPPNSIADISSCQYPHLRLLPSEISYQQQCSGVGGRQQTAVSTDVYRPHSAVHQAQQIHYRQNQNQHLQQSNNPNKPQSQMLKWQGGNDVTPPIINHQQHHNHHQQQQQAGVTNNVNRSGALFSNLDNTATTSSVGAASTLPVKPSQEELTSLQAAIRAMSWNSLRHDPLYRVRHSSYGGQDYYRQLYQQQRRFQSQHRMTMELDSPVAGVGFTQQHETNDHATKMMKLDGGAVGSSSVSSSSISSQQQQYHPHNGVGGQSRARSIQQIRYQHQPIRLNNNSASGSSAKELNENNFTDDPLNYNHHRKDGKDGHYLHQQQHLVKTISDLPVFVTIEDFRVASYTIAGEPHLCLPQLLQFLRQHFDTKTMVEKFEESLIHFPSATPKQVEGFIKSSCLPPSAKSCPLIKRSDADKICLSLFEELSNATDNKPLGDIVSLCSNQQHKNQEKQSDSPNKNDSIEEGSSCGIAPSESSNEQRVSVEDKSSSHDDADSSCNNSSAPKTHSPKDVMRQEKNRKNDISLVATTSNDDADADDDYDKYATVKKKLKCNYDDYDTVRSDSSSTQDANEDITRDDGDMKNEQCELSHDKISPKSQVDGREDDLKQQARKGEDATSRGDSSSGASSSGKTRDTLFETEAQSSILNFARAVTSTLMIRVYHKCFGKCIGLFYPSLLSNNHSECIQCTTCKVMLTPRRFVGHTHGSKENDVCHWGFNSYNWRSYIRLSKKQPMNNLDEDELLNQFNTLTAPAANEPIDRPSQPLAQIEQIPTEKSANFGQPCCAAVVSTSSATAPSQEPDYKRNYMQSKTDPPTRIVGSDRVIHRQFTGDTYAARSIEESVPQQSHLNSGTNNTSISMMRRYSTTDESSSHTLHAASLSSTTATLSDTPTGIECNPHYVSRHGSSLDDRSPLRAARSASISGRLATSACCGGGRADNRGGMVIPVPTRLTPQLSKDHYGAMSDAASGTVASSLYAQPGQLTDDLRKFLLQNWSPPTAISQPHTQQHTTTPQLSLLPLAPLSLPVSSGQSGNPIPPMELARPLRSTNEDLAKHLSLSAESKRELHVCTNLSTYLSRRGLSAGMTGDIVEKVLNLMRESRLTL